MIFIDIVRKAFGFLKKDYGCSLSFTKDNLQTDVIYQNSTTAIIIRDDIRENHITIFLVRLIDGKIPPYPIFITPKITLNIFDFDDLINLRSPSLNVYQENSLTKKELERILTEYASALKDFCVDILNGDFKVFSELETIVKERALSNN